LKSFIGGCIGSAAITEVEANARATVSSEKDFIPEFPFAMSSIVWRKLCRVFRFQGSCSWKRGFQATTTTRERDFGETNERLGDVGSSDEDRRMRHRFPRAIAPCLIALTLALTLALALDATPGAAAPKGPQILTGDVTRFFQVYDGAGGHPSAETLERDYLAPGSDGLHRFQKLRNVTGARIADAIAAHPETYAGARRCLAVLPQVKQRLGVAFARLARLYPRAKVPPVTLVVGRGRPVGVTDATGVYIGLEAMCSADFMNPDLTARFVNNIAHEYGHIQQPADIQLLNPGDPGATVLMVSLIEGAAEFAGELIAGDVGQAQHKLWTKGREAEIEAAFVRDEDKTDLSAWLYNGPGDPAHPGDLGYWVGYRIVKSYYDHAADKRQALSDIFNMHDPKAFLAASGWRPAQP